MRGGSLGHVLGFMFVVRSVICLFVHAGCFASFVCFVLLRLMDCVVKCFVV